MFAADDQMVDISVDTDFTLSLAWPSDDQMADANGGIRIRQSVETANADGYRVAVIQNCRPGLMEVHLSITKITVGRMASSVKYAWSASTIDPVRIDFNMVYGGSTIAMADDTLCVDAQELVSSGCLIPHGDQKIVQVRFETRILHDDQPDREWQSLGQLGSSLALLRSDDSLAGLADLSLCVGGREFRVHKAILSCQSPVFRQMLQVDMQEKKNGRVDIDEIDAETVERFLSFLYQGRFPSDATNMEHLLGILRAAHMYQVDSLQAECVARIRSEMDRGNVLDVLREAQRLDKLDLKEIAMSFATNCDDVMSDLVDLKDFDDLPHQLTTEMLVRFARKRHRDSSDEFPNDSDWRSLSLAQLQRACAERKLPSVGVTADLANRLEQHDSR